MANTQNSHLHPFASARKPPAMGPTTGPRMGPIDHNDMYRALLSRGIKSAIVPLPMVVGATPTKPARNRNTINMAMVCDNALIMVKTKNSVLQV